jgi:ribosomal protein S18 acetylase RimI-like enzyme
MSGCHDISRKQHRAEDQVTIRLMTASDIERGMDLKQAAGWNQTPSDWLRFLTLGSDCCFVATVDNFVVGTVASCLFDSVAWIGMLLVDEEYRRVGVATRLMQHVLSELDRHDARSIRLDATPMGVGLYDKLGFKRQFRVTRYGGIPRITPALPSHYGTTPYVPEHLDAVLRLDQQVTRVDRSKLIRSLLTKDDTFARVVLGDAGLNGFLIARPGSNAIQIGPVVASQLPAGTALLLDAVRCYRNETCYIDIPEFHSHAIELMNALQLSPLREFLRMCRGVPTRERTEELWAGSGPEKG